MIEYEVGNYWIFGNIFAVTYSIPPIIKLYKTKKDKNISKRNFYTT